MTMILIGMNNPHADEALVPTRRGDAASRLEAITGVTIKDHFDCLNMCCDRYWNPAAARRRGVIIRQIVTEAGVDKVVVLGRDAWRALGFKAAESAIVIVANKWHRVPHPSGKNLWYNSQANRTKVKRLFEALVKSSESSSTPFVASASMSSLEAESAS
jgi:hypothetical protein